MSNLTDYLNHQAWTKYRTLGEKKCKLNGCKICEDMTNEV
jgi:hypothetical protein